MTVDEKLTDKMVTLTQVELLILLKMIRPIIIRQTYLL